MSWEESASGGQARRLRRKGHVELWLVRAMANGMREGVSTENILRGLEAQLAGVGGASARALHEAAGSMLRDVEDGRSIVAAIDRNCADLLREETVAALRQAEGSGRIADLLPVLLRQIKERDSDRFGWRRALVFPLLELFIVWAVCTGMNAFVLVRYEMMFNEMLPSVALPGWWMVCRVILRFLCYAVFVFGAVFALWSFGSFLMSLIADVRPGILRRWVLSRTAALGRRRRRRCELAFCRVMRVLLAAGADLPEAAETAVELSLSRRIRRCGLDFAQRVRAGELWDEAWQLCDMGTPLTSWAMRNAMARERPAQAFDVACHVLQRDVTRRTKRLRALVAPALLCVTSLMVVCCALCAFGLLALLESVVVGVEPGQGLLLLLPALAWNPGDSDG